MVNLKTEELLLHKMDIAADSKVEPKLLYKTAFGKLQLRTTVRLALTRSSRSSKRSAAADNSQKWKFPKNSEKLLDVVVAPAWLLSAIQTLHFKNHAAFFDMIWRLQSSSHQDLTTPQIARSFSLLVGSPPTLLIGMMSLAGLCDCSPPRSI